MPTTQAPRRGRLTGWRVGGYEVDENPDLDARSAHPEWLASAGTHLHVRRAQARDSADRFDLWRIPGRKRLTLGGSEVMLTADTAALRLRASLSNDLADGDGYAVSVPLTPSLRNYVDAFAEQAAAFRGEMPSPSALRPVTRAAMLHLRALQSLDASMGGASHREIAQVLVGQESAKLRWHADGELRAQVRYLLRRARAFAARDYLSLLG